jgi:magnesium-transporting ATPase (P-type)
MVTGDQATTAAAIAGQAGLGGGQVLQGGEPLDRLADQELSARLASHTVVPGPRPRTNGGSSGCCKGGERSSR